MTSAWCKVRELTCPLVSHDLSIAQRLVTNKTGNSIGSLSPQVSVEESGIRPRFKR